jgi:hypothetical protein
MFRGNQFLSELQWQTIRAYQTYGYAMAQAQVLENTIVSCVAALALLGACGETKEQVQEMIVLNEKSVLGPFIGHLHSRTDLPPHLTAAFEQACNRRNYIAHYFFLYTTEQWSTSGDLVDLAVELKGDATLFGDMITALTTYVCPGIAREFEADFQSRK